MLCITADADPRVPGIAAAVRGGAENDRWLILPRRRYRQCDVRVADLGGIGRLQCRTLSAAGKGRYRANAGGRDAAMLGAARRQFVRRIRQILSARGHADQFAARLSACPLLRLRHTVIDCGSILTVT